MSVAVFQKAQRPSLSLTFSGFIIFTKCNQVILTGKENTEELEYYKSREQACPEELWPAKSIAGMLSCSPAQKETLGPGLLMAACILPELHIFMEVYRRAS